MVNKYRDKSRYLSAREAAEYLCVHKTTLLRWRKENKYLSFVRVPPKHIRYDIEELKRFKNSEIKFLTPAEAAAYLGVTTRTLFRWRKSEDKNKLPYYDWGKKTVKYRLGDLAEFAYKKNLGNNV